MNFVRRLFGNTSAASGKFKEIIAKDTASHDLSHLKSQSINGATFCYFIPSFLYRYNNLYEYQTTNFYLIKVVIYSKSYCPYCHSTKNLFQSEFSEVPVKVFELDKMKDGSSIQSDLAQITGQRTVPNVWVRGKFVGGNDDIQALFRSEKLKEMLSA